MEELGIIILGFALIFYLTILAISVLMYVLQSLALHKLAKKRGIPNYGLAWVPIGSSWILGKLADDVNLCRRNKKTHFARNLLVLNLVYLGFFFLLYIGAFVASIAAIVNVNVGGIGSVESTGVAIALVGILAWFVLMGLVVTLMVLFYMALYRVFYGYAEDNATVFLVLSIFISPLQPIFLFIMRNRELLPPDPTTFTQSYGFPSPPPYASEPAVEEIPVNFENNSDTEDNNNE